MSQTFTHLMYVPFTGLGLYNGFRGNPWLKNRIRVFKQFVVPSLAAQTNKDFVLWVSWRPEERNNPHVRELHQWLQDSVDFRFIFTYGGVCFWDDKYDDETAWNRLVLSIHNTMRELINEIGPTTHVLMTIQPSDDLYARDTVEKVQKLLSNPDVDAVGFSKGYIMNYKSGEVAEYNPTTNPPFFTIKFARADFIEPLSHIKHTGPYRSHEYVGNKLRYVALDERGFLVGTHENNISTVYNHPFKGRIVDNILREFGIEEAGRLEVKTGFAKRLLLALPHRWQRKIRYWFGELLLSKIISFHA